ncbi:MAG: TrbI/VirB10 family protein [Hyphomonadaceae bacterium]
MADGLPPKPPAGEAAPDSNPPPPLSAIRVKGPGAKGLNKPAILIAAGGSIGLVLILASGGLTNDPAKRPSETRPVMSDPARPEMAQSAIRRLPTTYEEAAQIEASRLPAQPPVLGPPMAGDVAAFAPTDAGYSSTDASWSGEPDVYDAAPPQPDPAEQEAMLADRSAIAFELTQQPQAPAVSAPLLRQQQPPLAALRQRPDDPSPVPAATPAKRALHPGAVIPASLVTAVNSEAPGPVIAQVTQSVYDSATGRTLVIPQGARLIGDYRSSSRYGQSRVAIIWSRLIMPNGDEIMLDEAAVDPSGAAGVQGNVDNHWGEVFGAAALGTLINVGVATTEENPSITYGGIGLTSTYDPVDDALRDGAQRTASIVTNRVVDRSLTITPTIRLDAGTRISVIVTRKAGF